MQHSSGHQSIHQIVVTTRSLFIEITLKVIEKQNNSIHVLAFIFFFRYVVVKNPVGGKNRCLIVLVTTQLRASSALKPISDVYMCA
jgi:hypothetical protein